MHITASSHNTWSLLAKRWQWSNASPSLALLPVTFCCKDRANHACEAPEGVIAGVLGVHKRL
jgi:hypothetical protein